MKQKQNYSFKIDKSIVEKPEDLIQGDLYDIEYMCYRDVPLKHVMYRGLNKEHPKYFYEFYDFKQAKFFVVYVWETFVIKRSFFKE